MSGDGIRHLLLPMRHQGGGSEGIHRKSGIGVCRSSEASQERGVQKAAGRFLAAGESAVS